MALGCFGRFFLPVLSITVEAGGDSGLNDSTLPKLDWLTVEGLTLPVLGPGPRQPAGFPRVKAGATGEP